MSNRGHNENAVRLSMLADDAQRGLEQVARGESDAIEGWIAYGAALNEGRALFPGDREFGQWVASACFDNLSVRPNEHEQVAAMWAAANLNQFHEARAAGKARTVRGIHTKWKEIEDEREKERIEAERRAEEERRQAEADTAVEDASSTATSVKAEIDHTNTGSGSKPDQKSLPASAPAQPVVTQVEPDVGEPDSAAPGTAPSGADQNKISADEATERRELAKLTDEALIDEVIGLRAENAGLRREVEEVKRERDDLKATVRDLSADNQGATISRIKKELVAVKFARDNAQTEVKRMEYRLKKAEERVAELESMGIEIAV